MSRIAFFGLGIMGAGMVRTLLRHGHTLAVYNRTPARAEPFAALGARIAATPADAAQDAEVLISMVMDDPASRSVWLGEQGALSVVPSGALCIEAGTLTPKWIRELAQHVRARGGELLDTPVTGSKVQAENGELVFIAGGSPDALARARPILEQLGKTIHRLGPVGSGVTMKLINNSIAGVQQVVLAEAMAFAEAEGMDLNRAAELLMAGPVGSPLVKRKLPPILEHDYTPTSGLALMHKDMTYALDLAVSANIAMPTVAAAREVMCMGMVRGWSEQDSIIVHELFRPPL